MSLFIFTKNTFAIGKDKKMPRRLFTDGVNSLAHFSFGIISYFYPFSIPVFVLYQLATPDENTFIDLTEYGFGLALGKIVDDNKT